MDVGGFVYGGGGVRRPFDDEAIKDNGEDEDGVDSVVGGVRWEEEEAEDNDGEENDRKKQREEPEMKRSIRAGPVVAADDDEKKRLNFE